MCIYVCVTEKEENKQFFFVFVLFRLVRSVFYFFPRCLTEEQRPNKRSVRRMKEYSTVDYLLFLLLLLFCVVTVCSHWFYLFFFSLSCEQPINYQNGKRRATEGFTEETARSSFGSFFVCSSEDFPFDENAQLIMIRLISLVFLSVSRCELYASLSPRTRTSTDQKNGRSRFWPNQCSTWTGDCFRWLLSPMHLSTRPSCRRAILSIQRHRSPNRWRSS